VLEEKDNKQDQEGEEVAFVKASLFANFRSGLYAQIEFISIKSIGV
jgi:hypothetical protein